MHGGFFSIDIDSDPRSRDCIPTAPGSYVVVLRSAQAREISVGQLGALLFASGFYLYVGSAFGAGGLCKRVARHVNGATQRRHWHIDYLRAVTQPVALWYCTGERDDEHRWAAALARCPTLRMAHARFGASDCDCQSHLYFARQRPALITF